MESLAYNIRNEVSNSTLVCSLIDAKNDNVYCGLYNFIENDCKEIAIFAENIDTTIKKINKILLTNTYSDVLFVGNASFLFKETLKQDIVNLNIKFADNKDNLQNSISIAKASIDKFHRGIYGDSSTLSPIYLKKSQAERALEEKVQIAEMTIDDINFLSPNFNNEFDKFWNINNLTNDFNNPNSSYFVAKLDNEIVGFVGFLKIIDEADIMNIATKVDKRNLGIATKLLNYVIEYAQSQGLKSITLEVNENNLSAIHLYEKLNFKRIGLRKKYYNNTDNAILMTLML